MRYATVPYDEAVEYLARYAADDWLEMSIVTDHANQILGRDATKSEIAEVALRLSGDLIERGALPGDLTAEEPGFRAWPGDKLQLLERLGKELQAMVARDRLPMPTDVCWFHVVAPEQANPIT